LRRVGALPVLLFQQLEDLKRLSQILKWFEMPNADCCCRPWYSFSATDPKDIIVMIDKSSSMLATYLASGEKKLTVAIKAAMTAINSLNTNDNVSMETHYVQLCQRNQYCFGNFLAKNGKIRISILFLITLGWN